MPISRRRFLTIAAAAGSALLGPAPGMAGDGFHCWQGAALGADACLYLSGVDRLAADRLIEQCLKEVARLERVFSLHRSDSALVRLNREGRLALPPIDLVRLMQEAIGYSHLSDGAFDMSVQPLWTLYAQHFSSVNARAEGPPGQAVEAVRRLIDFRAVEVEASHIVFTRPGMAVTLNGIAQGYITDRIAELLLQEGMRDALVDMGEIRALGNHPEGRPWRASVRQGAANPALNLEGALATSALQGTCFDPGRCFGHILDPRTGVPAAGDRQITVRAATACRADALSTAFLLLPAPAISALAARFSDVQILTFPMTGRG